MDNRVEKLINAIARLREFSHTQDDLKEVKSCLNLLFKSKAECANFVYTVNTDKLPFGCVVFPVMDQNTISAYLIAGEDISINRYEIELDSKMFDYGLTDEEIAEVMIFNIYHLINGNAACDRVREAIDDFFVMSGTQLIIRSSIQYQAILNMGLVDALHQVSSCFCLPNDILSDPFLESLGLSTFKKALEKIYRELPGCDNEVTRQPNLSMLNWALRLYCNVDKERIPALHLMDKAKDLTASNLYIAKFNMVINALNRIDTDLFVNESVMQVFTESKRKGGLLATLKYSGLRDLENDLYTFQLMAKNAETESEVLYALKQINARISILDDYIREYQDSDPDIERWINLKMEYMDIRDILARKKLHKRSYGIFVDYDALDRLDSENESTTLLDESFLIINESVDSDEIRKRKLAVNEFKSFFKEAMKKYFENDSKIKKGDINDVILHPTSSTKSFIRGESDTIEYKIGSSSAIYQIPLNIISALLSGFTYIEIGRKKFNRAMVKATASKDDLYAAASQYCGIEIVNISVSGKNDKFLYVKVK